MNHSYAWRIGKLHRSGYERDACSQFSGRAGNGVALLPRGPIGDVTHGINRLMGRAAGDDNMASGQRADRLGVREKVRDGCGDLQRLGHPAGTSFAALGHFAAIGADEANAIARQGHDVALGCRMHPHARVHRRGGEDRFVGRKKHGGGEVISVSAGHAREHVGRGRSNNDQIGFAAEADVADVVFVLAVEQLGEDAVAGYGAYGQRCDELLCGTSHDRAHAGAAFPEPTDQVEALIGGNAAADDEKNALAVHVRGRRVLGCMEPKLSTVGRALWLIPSRLTDQRIGEKLGDARTGEGEAVGDPRGARIGGACPAQASLPSARERQLRLDEGGRSCCRERNDIRIAFEVETGAALAEPTQRRVDQHRLFAHRLNEEPILCIEQFGEFGVDIGFIRLGAHIPRRIQRPRPGLTQAHNRRREGVFVAVRLGEIVGDQEHAHERASYRSCFLTRLCNTMTQDTDAPQFLLTNSNSERKENMPRIIGKVQPKFEFCSAAN